MRNGPRTNTFADLVDDLATETGVVRTLLDDLDDAGWDSPTPAAGWAVRDQVSHLAFFDDATTLSMVDATRFVIHAEQLMARSDDFANALAEEYRSLAPRELLSWFARSREVLISTFLANDPRGRVPWYGVEMSVMSAATARLMETWAHGVDIAESIGAPIVATTRLRHIVHLGVSTMGFSFKVRGLVVPSTSVRVCLEAPDGSQWTYGPDDAPDRVEGSALDFCLLVTQRRNLLDTALEVTGDTASTWMRVAQAFAGPPSDGRIANYSTENSV